MVQTSELHSPVMLQRCLDLLQPGFKVAQPVAIDCTLGLGGHTEALLTQNPTLTVIGIDRDPSAITLASERLEQFGERFIPVLAVYDEIESILDRLEIPAVHGILMDLGVSSPQIDNPERGFSFRFDGPLDMRMDTTRGQSVAQWLASATAQEITEVVRDYGDERFAVQIAKAIVARRQAGRPVAGTTDLARLVADTVKTREPGQNPATRTFQAFRIFINAELEELEQALAASLQVLREGGRLVVISFHSLEDRIVKQFMAAHAREVVDRRAPFASPRPMPLQLLGRSRPSAQEVQANPRARSAIMRVAERTGAPA